MLSTTCTCINNTVYTQLPSQLSVHYFMLNHVQNNSIIFSLTKFNRAMLPTGRSVVTLSIRGKPKLFCPPPPPTKEETFFAVPHRNAELFLAHPSHLPALAADK